MRRRHFLQLLASVPAAIATRGLAVEACAAWDPAVQPLTSGARIVCMSNPVGPNWLVRQLRDDITQICGVPIFDEG